MRLPLLLVLALLFPACAVPTDQKSPSPALLSTGTPDGWASAEGAPAQPGGTGGATYTVRTRGELIAALKAGGTSVSNAPKIIYVEGLIDLCADEAGVHLTPEDFLTQQGVASTYPTYADYRAAYAASCATGTASTLAALRSQLAARQKAVMQIAVGSNTSLLGSGAGAGFINGSLSIDNRTNVVVRNLTVLDAYDDFPLWDEGENLINSSYDGVSVTGSTYVWIDHCRFGDGAHPDSGLPSVTISGLSKKWVTHDGLCDVTKGSNYVTVSWCRFEDHDKTMLVGASDSASATDEGKLKLTVHHNWFQGAKQRLPRVRFGQVHVYNNYYQQVGGYAVGVGDRARIYSEANVFEAVAHAFDTYDDTANEGYYFDVGSTGVTGTETMASAADVGWTPSAQYAYTADPASSVAAKVTAGAGAGKL